MILIAHFFPEGHDRDHLSSSLKSGAFGLVQFHQPIFLLFDRCALHHAATNSLPLTPETLFGYLYAIIVLCFAPCALPYAVANSHRTIRNPEH